MIKKTRTVHRIYKEWQKLPKEIQKHPFFSRKCIIGKWHYHYEKDGKEISLVRFNHSLAFSIKPNQHHYEACGTLDFERFATLSKAEDAIYKKLGELKKDKYLII